MNQNHRASKGQGDRPPTNGQTFYYKGDRPLSHDKKVDRLLNQNKLYTLST
ncbi:MAG: hypothetical protein LBQ77_00350 [Treponema sp.]|nr:hypothetical protein [Treponema sp.]